MDVLRCLMPLLFAVSSAWGAQGQPVESAPASSGADIHDIRGPVTTKGLPPFILTGGMLLLAGGGLVIHRHLRRKSRQQLVAMPLSLATRPDALALLARLAADYREGVCPGGQSIIRLDAWIRGALAEMTGMPALRLTSMELKLQAGTCFTDDERAQFGQLVALCDLVKFASYQPDVAEIERALNTTLDLFSQPMARWVS